MSDADVHDGHESPPPESNDDNRGTGRKRFQRDAMETLTALKDDSAHAREALGTMQIDGASSRTLLESIGANIAQLVKRMSGNGRASTTGSGSATVAGADGGADTNNTQFALTNPGYGHGDTGGPGPGASNAGVDDASSYVDDGSFDGSASFDGQRFKDNEATADARNQEERRKDVAKARRAAERLEWAKPNRKAHWMLSGAPPINHQQAVMQSVLDTRVKVSDQVHRTLSNLTMFRVRSFMPRDAMPMEIVPINVRMYIMGQSLVTLAAESVPKVPQIPHAERAIRLQRVQKLFDSFATGLKVLTFYCDKYRALVADPKTGTVIGDMIDEDMADWSRRLHKECATAGPGTYDPPQSAAELPPVIVPEWVHLTPFLESGTLAIANARAKGKLNRSASSGQAASPGKPAAKRTEDCRQFAEGRCQRTNCKYRHRTTGAGSSEKGGKKRNKGDSTTNPAKKKAKKAKAAAATAAKKPAAEAAAAEPDGDESE